MIRKVIYESINPNDGLIDAADSVFQYELIKNKLYIVGLNDNDNVDFIVPEVVTYEGKEYPVYGIGDLAFKNTNIRSIALSDTVVKIDANAFENCKSLKTINLQDVDIIGKNAFSGCKSLKYIDIRNVERIEEGVFMNCSSLEAVNICGDLWSVGKNAFSGCLSLEYIDLPTDIGMIGVNAFDKCPKLQFPKLKKMTL